MPKGAPKVRKNYRFKQETIDQLRASLAGKNEHLQKNNFPEWTETDLIEYLIANHYRLHAKTGQIKASE